MRQAFTLALPLAAAVLFAGCSSAASTSGSAALAARPAPAAPEYVASPTKYWEALSDAKRRDVAAEKSAATSRTAGAAVKPVSRPAASPRSFPEPTAPVAVAQASAPVPATACPPQSCPPKACPPKFCIDPCAGGKCCLPPPAFCDPCAGGKCGIPEPVFTCDGR